MYAKRVTPVYNMFVFAGVMFLLTTCAPQQQPDFTAAMEEYFSRYFPAGEPGGAVLVMHGDSIIFSRGYGMADLKTRQPVTPQTRFNLGSLSKTFVANAVLKLQEQGKLSVEDSLIQYFPNFKNPGIARRIKIKHLLTHTSGLPDNRQVGKDTAFYLYAKDAGNWYPETQVDALLFEPGSRYQYSNPAFNGLALIVEQVSGMPWQQFVKQQIFTPAGMHTSTITDGPHPTTGVAHGYVYNGSTWTEDDYGEEPTFPAAGNGGVWSSVEELARYEQALRRATFLKPETIRNARTLKTFSHWQGERPPFIGWSWFVTEHKGLTRIGHSGSQGGFLTNYVTIPEKDILFVILCNAPRESYEMRATTDVVLNLIEKYNWLRP